MDPPAEVLPALGVTARRCRRVGGDRHPLENQHWHVLAADGGRWVLRRHAAVRTPLAVAYEHAVLRAAADAGWTVPVPRAVRQPVLVDGRLYSLYEYVAGRPPADTLPSRRRRGVLLARLHATLQPLTARLGQRDGFDTIHPWFASPDDWRDGISRLSSTYPALAERAVAACARVTAELDQVDARALRCLVLHGDFTPWNLRGHQGRTAVLDFDLTHVGSRAWELAIARVQRFPETLVAFRQEAARLGAPLTEHEEAAIAPLYRALKIEMIGQAMGAPAPDPDFIAQQLVKAGA